MSGVAYYNETNPYCVEWLTNLTRAGLIAPGDIDTRSVEDISPSDLRGYTQCHFFAGIGVWSYGARLGGWPDDVPLWTGSCPCQPFSSAGKRKGTSDERHLWPAWFHLIEQCRPPVIFGEQVEGAIRHGWLDLVSSDLEGIGYSIGAVVLPAAGFGAPHMRHRLCWVADADGGITGAERIQRGGEHGQLAADCGAGAWDDPDWLPCTDGLRRPVEAGTSPLAHGSPSRLGRIRAYGNAIVPQVAAEMIAAFQQIRKSGIKDGNSQQEREAHRQAQQAV